SSGLLLRFIPACAGNTLPWLFLRYYVSIHPRMRGEHLLTAQQTYYERGSSPHARGTRLRSRCQTECGRFIPACAGNTTAQDDTHSQNSVHPRMRGEHSMGQKVSCWPNGSSPHARGTPHRWPSSTL